MSDYVAIIAVIVICINAFAQSANPIEKVVANIKRHLKKILPACSSSEKALLDTFYFSWLYFGTPFEQFKVLCQWCENLGLIHISPNISPNRQQAKNARSILLHPVQRYFNFAIPHYPSSSDPVPFIALTLLLH